MIYVLSLNPCLDKTASLPRFSPDAPNRIQPERQDIGGKGINVARVLQEMGGEGLLFSFDYAGAPIRAALEREHVPALLFPVPGELRVNLKLRETEGGRTIEISERGQTISAAALQAMEQALLTRCRPGDWVALSGSLPPGAPPDTYARLCRLLKERGCRAAVDCDGPALRQALETGPALLKPNAQEFFALTGADAYDPSAARAACRALHEGGVGMICLSLGEKGAVLSAGETAYFCPAAPVQALGVQGAGDSLLAGLLLSLARGEAPSVALRYGTAAAGASVMRPGTLTGRREDADLLLSRLPMPRRCF